MGPVSVRKAGSRYAGVLAGGIRQDLRQRDSVGVLRVQTLHCDADRIAALVNGLAQPPRRSSAINPPKGAEGVGAASGVSGG